VLVSLDFPQGKEAMAAVPNPARNKELSEKYGITGYPTVLLMKADGEVYAETGNNGTGPAEYAAHVRELRAQGLAATAAAAALTAKFDKATDKAVVVREAIAVLGQMPAGIRTGGQLAEIVRHGITLDPENKAGLKLASITALVTSGQAAEGERALARAMDPTNELGLMEAVLAVESENLPQDDEEALKRFVDHAKSLMVVTKLHAPQKVSMGFAYAAYYAMKTIDDMETARALAQKALDCGGLPEGFVQFLNENILK
jgi:hypothetical protein